MLDFNQLITLISLTSFTQLPSEPCQKSELVFRFDRLQPTGTFELLCHDSPEPSILMSLTLTQEDRAFLESWATWIRKEENPALDFEQLHLSRLLGWITEEEYFLRAISLYQDLPLGLSLVKSPEFTQVVDYNLLGKLILEAARLNSRRLLDYYLDHFPEFDLQWKLNRSMVGAATGKQEALVKELVERGANEFDLAISRAVDYDQGEMIDWLLERHRPSVKSLAYHSLKRRAEKKGDRKLMDVLG